MAAIETSSRTWRPRQKPFKSAVVKAALFALGSALEAAAVLDEDVRHEVATWKDPFSVLFQVVPNGPSMVFEKRNGKLVFKGTKAVKADLSVYFKNMESAFLILSGQIGTPQGYAEHRMTLKGDTSQGMGLIRVLNVVQFYLFPKILAQRIIKRLPEMTPKKMLNRFLILGVGIPLGFRRL